MFIRGREIKEDFFLQNQGAIEMAINILEKTDYSMMFSAQSVDESNIMRSGADEETARSSVALNAVVGGSNMDQVKTITALKDSSDRLVQAAQDLTVSGKESLFWGISIVSGDDDLKSMTKGQTKDAVYRQVSEFVNSYNGMLTIAAKSENTKVHSVATDMQRMTVANEDSLAEVGVTVGKDNKLSISEQTLKDAQIDILKKRFEDVASYANGIQTEASLINMYAKEDAAKTGGMYAQDARFNNVYASSGHMFDSAF